MANPYHVAVVKKGAAAIKEWKQKHPGQTLNLSEANLSKVDLSGTDLRLANLIKANLSGANLSKANLSFAILASANLSGANLSEANIGMGNLINADLSGANLSGAILFESNLSGVNLISADLSGADLSYILLKFAKLSEANFSNANLDGAKLLHFDASKVNLTGAIMDATTLGACNLAHGVGLETVKHKGPSLIDYITLIRSFREAGNRFTPEMETFFLNSGLPKELLEALPRILAEVQYYTCFVCYGHPDLGFAERLVKDLKAMGIPCWLYSMDYTPGKKVWGEIIQKRREAEKMIVLCSAKSLVRDAVLKEIEEQIDENPDKIVPISLDDLWKESGFSGKRGKRDLKPFLLERNYADFCHESAYNNSLRRLLKGLKRTEK